MLSKYYFTKAAKSSKILTPARIEKFFFVLLLPILFFCVLETEAQPLSWRFKFSTGYSNYLLETPMKISPVYALGASPQINLWEPKWNFSIALVTPVSVGIHLKTKVLNRLFVFTDIPLMCEFNYGHLATKDFRKWWGAFIGGGYAFQTVGTAWQQGACLSGGFRFWLFKQSFTLRYAKFFSGFASGYHPSHRLCLEINLGKFLAKVNFKNKLEKFEKPFQGR